MSEDNIYYEFVASDKTVVHLRRMSDRERTRFVGFNSLEIGKLFQAFATIHDANLIPDGEAARTVEDAQEPYDAWRHAILKYVGALFVAPEDRILVESWNHPGDWSDLMGLTNAIVNAESPQVEGTVIPPPDVAEELADKEIERLGEPLPPKSPRASTSRSSTAAATSSAGVGSTAATKPATSATSPSPS